MKQPISKLPALLAGALGVGVLFSETVTHDDLADLRPNTQGVETNAFWDTRGNTAYPLNKGFFASTNVIATAFVTQDAVVGNLDVPKGFSIILR